jgi:hypothetical protein
MSKENKPGDTIYTDDPRRVFVEPPRTTLSSILYDTARAIHDNFKIENIRVHIADNRFFTLEGELKNENSD